MVKLDIVKCRKCRKILSSEWAYCPNCGNKNKGYANSGDSVTNNSKSLRVNCSKCHTANIIDNHYCTNCGADIKDDVFQLYKDLEKQTEELRQQTIAATKQTDNATSSLDIDHERQQARQDYQKLADVSSEERQVLQAYAGMAKTDYRRLAISFLKISAVCLPLQALLLVLVINMRQHSPDTANTIFMDGIIFTGSVNIIGCLSSLAAIVSAKVKGNI